MSAVYPILIWKPSQKTIATKHRHSNTFSFHSMNHWRAATRRPTRATDESFVKSSSKTGRSRGSQPRIAECQITSISHTKKEKIIIKTSEMNRFTFNQSWRTNSASTNKKHKRNGMKQFARGLWYEQRLKLLRRVHDLADWRFFSLLLSNEIDLFFLINNSAEFTWICLSFCVCVCVCVCISISNPFPAKTKYFSITKY